MSAIAALDFLLALFVVSHRLLLLLPVLKFGLLLFLGRLFRLLLAVWTHENLGGGRRRKRRKSSTRTTVTTRFIVSPRTLPILHQQPALPHSGSTGGHYLALYEGTHVRSDIAKVADQPALS